MTYRAAAAVLREETGTAISAPSVHTWVQELGQRAEAEEFSGSGAAAAGAEVVVEWDETTVRSQEKGERQFELKFGIGYSQKRRRGPQRWELADKMVYGDRKRRRGLRSVFMHDWKAAFAWIKFATWW